MIADSLEASEKCGVLCVAWPTVERSVHSPNCRLQISLAHKGGINGCGRQSSRVATDSGFGQVTSKYLLGLLICLDILAVVSLVPEAAVIGYIAVHGQRSLFNPLVLPSFSDVWWGRVVERCHCNRQADYERPINKMGDVGTSLPSS